MSVNHNWRPLTQKPEPGFIWVRWLSMGHEMPYSSIAYYDEDEFKFVQAADSYQRHDHYTFDYIGKVTHWQPLIEPTPLEI